MSISGAPPLGASVSSSEPAVLALQGAIDDMIRRQDEAMQIDLARHRAQLSQQQQLETSMLLLRQHHDAMMRHLFQAMFSPAAPAASRSAPD